MQESLIDLNIFSRIDSIRKILNPCSMKNSKILALSLVACFSFAACGSANDEAAQETVNSAIKNLSKAQSAEFVLEANGNVGGVEGPEGEDVDLDMDMTIDGSYSNAERSNPMFALAIDGSGSTDGESEESVDLEMRFANENFFFVVNDISDMGGELPTAMVAPFLGQWYFMELPADYVSTFNVYSGDEEELTEEEKAMKELFESTDFFTNVANEGSEKVDSVDTTKYSVELDNAAVRNYFLEGAKINGTAPTEAEIEEMDEFLAASSFKGNVWVADDKLKKVSGELKIGDLEDADAEISLSYTVDKVGEEVSVEVPAGAELFDPFALMMGAASMEGL
mgnify:CR=1 FL=1